MSNIYHSYIYPALRRIRRNILPEMMEISQGRSPRGISSLTEKILGFKKKKKRKVRCHFNLQNKQCKFPPFWRTRAWVPRVVTTNDIPPYIPQSKPYSMVIFPALFIFPTVFIFLAYEGDSALNHMVRMWYLNLRYNKLEDSFRASL